MLKLKELRQEKGLYQKDLAKTINKTITCICDWERGRTEPSIENLKELADYFNCSVDYLIGREKFDTGNIEIVGEQLNDKEKKLLERFRRLDQDGQNAFLDIADNITRMYNKTNQNIS